MAVTSPPSAGRGDVPSRGHRLSRGVLIRESASHTKKNNEDLNLSLLCFYADGVFGYLHPSHFHKLLRQPCEYAQRNWCFLFLFFFFAFLFFMNFRAQSGGQR